MSVVGTVVLSVWLFPAGSPIVDERVYVQQGRALAQGALVLPPSFDPDHRPFFTAPNDRGELVFKYTQVWPALLGASWKVTGSERAAVGLAVGLGVAALAAFTHALTRRRRVTILATCCFAAAPSWLVLSASFLSYAVSLGLGLLAGAALIVSWRPAVSRPWAMSVAAGLLAGVAVFARPFDAVLLLAPIGLVVGVRFLRCAGPGDGIAAAGQRLGLHVVGAAVPIAVLLGINHRITGHALELGYSLVGPMDQLGFGDRLDIDRGDPLLHYGPSEAIRTLGRGLQLLVRWWPGSVVGIVATGIGVLALRSGWQRIIVVVGLVSTPLAYVGVWGAWNAHIRLRSADLMGPYYYLPVTAFAAVVIGCALTRAGTRRTDPVGTGPTRRWGVPFAAAAAGVALSLVALWAPLRHLRTVSQDIARQRDALDAMAQPFPSLIMVDGRDLGYDAAAYNDVGLDGDVVYALDDPARRIAILRRFPDRRAVRLESRYVFAGRPGSVQFRDGLGFDRQVVQTSAQLEVGPSLQLHARVPDVPAAPAGAGAPSPAWYVTTPSGAWIWPMTSPGVEIELGPTGVTLDGARGDPASGLDSDPDGFCVGVLGAPDRDEVCYVAELSGSTVSVVLPGTPRTAFAAPAGTRMLAADVSDRLAVDVNDR